MIFCSVKFAHIATPILLEIEVDASDRPGQGGLAA
jgi:hypothetical protein